jgi:hypothetical protein
MPKLTKEDFAKEEASIRALEQTTRERWCALQGHKWDLPQPNPLNSDMYSCDLECNRCRIRATLTIALLSAPNIAPLGATPILAQAAPALAPPILAAAATGKNR